MTRVMSLFLCFLFWITAVSAEPVPYALDLKASKVVFFYTMSGREGRGVFPVSSATTYVDLKNVRLSSIDTTVATKFVQAGDPLVSLALRGQDMLATRKHPSARFVSKKVEPYQDGVRVHGDLTLKGTTRPVTLNAVFQRYADAPKDNSELILQVSGTVSRKAFGINGYPEMVGDDITLRFQVHLFRE